ncbi:MAG: glycosyltransferase family 2 protein [Usitatibacter sp.]
MSTPRVSVLIPAYNERFFGAAFASARAQVFPDLEIVVCDDSPGDAIEATVRGANDARVRYQRNAQRLGFHGNFTECFHQARGELIKFLNDDDLLAPQCVTGLVAAFDFDPRVTLATSRRRPIDGNGAIVQGHLASQPLAHVSCLIPGAELANFVLVNSMNLIGEPTTAMFRKRDVALEGTLFSWGGREYHCLADLSLWVRLLARGHCFYQAVTLSDYRIHEGQEQASEAMDVACIVERFELAHQARTVGFLREAPHFRAAISMPMRMAEQALAGGYTAQAKDQLRALMERARSALA